MKSQLGQFFTTNADYILYGLESFVRNKVITDPFAGNQDLFVWAIKHRCKKITGFDCDKKYVDNKKVFYNDSINNPKEYKFILTNPPYLHKNKADNNTKTKFFSGIHAGFEDLYQVSIYSILNSDEGVVIVPLNFLSAENSQKIRNIFFEKFEIKKVNIFKHQVFQDTTYNVIAFYYQKKRSPCDKNQISAIIFPEKKQIKLIIERRFGWQMGGRFLSLVKNTKNNLAISRLTDGLLDVGENNLRLALQNIKQHDLYRVGNELKTLLNKNILLLRAIDSKNGKKIQLEDIRHYGVAGLVGKNTSRNMAHLIFGQEVAVNEQEELMKQFNELLNQNREKYFSFFLTNFRDNGRKRMSFDFAYKLLNYLYEQKHQKQSTLF